MANTRTCPRLRGRLDTLLSTCRRGLLPVLVGCVFSGVALAAPTANIVLSSSSATVIHTSDTEWTLSKYGVFYPADSSVSWEIIALPGATTSGHLMIQGTMTVTNTGSGPATIGNIVVNLQRKVGNKFVTASSDIANATDGDAATEADIHKAASSEGIAHFEENTASGELHFMDATNNTVFSLVPQVLIPSGGSRTLLFQASFDNTVLYLAAGTTIRAEVIVSFGNATANGNSTANVDINGNGSIDSDEARVRSVPARLTATVPAQIPGNSTVTLTDTLADIAKTGTVTFNPANVVFNLGATSGTVTIIGVSGGTSGGTITNCAHLTGSSLTTTSGGFPFSVIYGIDLTRCSQVEVAPSTCTPGVGTCGWRTNDLTTYDTLSWGNLMSAAGTLLATTFTTAYPHGLVAGSTYTILFDSASALITFLGTQTGTPGMLTENVENPDTTSAGTFAADVLALRINVDFAEANYLSGVADFGDLYICNTSNANLNGSTVSQFLATAESILGGQASPTFNVVQASAIANTLNRAFVAGAPSTFAESNLFVGMCRE